MFNDKIKTLPLTATYDEDMFGTMDMYHHNSSSSTLYNYYIGAVENEVHCHGDCHDFASLFEISQNERNHFHEFWIYHTFVWQMLHESAKLLNNIQKAAKLNNQRLHQWPSSSPSPSYGNNHIL